MNIKIVVTQEEHYQFANEICETIETSAKLRGTGIAKRTPEYILLVIVFEWFKRKFFGIKYPM